MTDERITREQYMEALRMLVHAAGTEKVMTATEAITAGGIVRRYAEQCLRDGWDARTARTRGSIRGGWRKTYPTFESCKEALK